MACVSRARLLAPFLVAASASAAPIGSAGLPLNAPGHRAGGDPDVTFTSGASLVSEGTPMISVQLALSQAATDVVTIPYTVSGTADAADATVPTGPLVIPIGQAGGTIDIQINDDALSEGSERILLTLGAPTNGNLGATTVHELTIVDNEPAATVAFDLPSSVAIESGGTVSLALTLSDARTEDATVAFSTAGTARIGGVDVTITSVSPLVLPGGTTAASIDVSIVSDSIDELDEDLIVTLLTPTNCVLGGASQHTLTITDDDDPPAISFSTPTSTAIETDPASAIGIELSVESSFDVTVPVTVGGTATEGVDFTWTPPTITILAGETTAAVDVTPIDDAVVETSEIATFTLGAPTGATPGAVLSHDLLIVDDDGGPRVVQFQTPGSMADEAAGLVSVTVELDDHAPQPVTVPVTAAGTATPTVDYDLVTTLVTIPVGALTASVDVLVLEDTEVEPAETVDLSLGAPSGASLGSGVLHTLTISDNDGPLTASFALMASTSPEGAGSVLVDVVLSGTAPADVTVPLVLTGTAQAGGVDVAVTPDPLVIGAGQTGGQFSVALTPDALYEDDETLVMTFGALTGADPGAIVEHTLTVENDDPLPVVEFTQYRTVVNEIEGGFDVRLVLDAPSGLDVTVPFTVTGDASGAGDVTLPPSPAVVPAGDAFVDLPVTLVVDRIPELAERIVFTLGPPTGATLGATSTLLVLVVDGDAGPIAVAPPLAPSVTDLVFPTTREGNSTVAQSLFFTNLHTAPVVLESVDMRGATPDDFVLSYPVPLPITVNPGASAQVDVAFAPLGAGPRSLELRARQRGQGAPPIPVRAAGVAYGPTGGEISMNAAPEPFAGPGGEVWTFEYGAVGGDPGSLVAPVGGTSLEGLYQTFRSGTSFDYALELPNGAYEVVLRTWEPIKTAAGERVFDVLLEGAVAVDDLDVFAEVGRQVAYDTPPMRVDVTDGMLDIGLRGIVARALVSAIEVRSIPVLSTTTSALGFGIVDQGTSLNLDVVIQNDGLHTGSIDRLTFQTASIGSSADFSIEHRGVTYQGAAVTAFYQSNIPLPPGATTIPVTFTPTAHEDHVFVLELEATMSGDMFPVNVSGTGGAEAGWGFLHPVPDSRPVFVVDYDNDGSELVQLLGAESHTHEPGRSLATYEWAVNGAPLASTVDTTNVFSVGSSTVELTIGDDNATPNFATDDRTITVHPVDRVPGPLIQYYDGSALGEVFLLDNLPGTVDFIERIQGLTLGAQDGKVGRSPYSGHVMVRWVADFDLAAARTLEVVAAGGVDRRVWVDGALAAGPLALGAGAHDVELRFAVTEIANLPLTLQVLEGGVPASDVQSSLVHDEQLVAPIIHGMPTLGSDLGGNRIEIDGFGFFPRDQTVVHWGTIDLTSNDFVEWTGERIVVNSPPGMGAVPVTVETPNGTSNAIQFVYSPTGPVPVRFNLLSSQQVSIANVTSAAWGPDGKLYVSVLDGSIRIITYDDSYGVQSIRFKGGVSGLVNRDTLAVAFNPFDVYDPQDPTSIKLYVSHGEQFQNGGGSFTGTSYFTGQVSVLTGPDFNSPQPISTGLPVSNHDHSVNGMVFDDNGDLLLCVGGNTNAGVKWPLIGDLPESPLSGCIARLRLSDPNFNGAVQYEDSMGMIVDDQVLGEEIHVVDGVDIDVYAPGLRNSYDLVLHTNGYLYATDNGPNDPYGPASLSATTNGGSPHPYTPDTIDLIEPGNYYGHANRSRGRWSPREHVFRSASAPSIPDVYSAPIALVDSSTNGIDEYRATAFNSGLRGELIAMKWNSGVYRVALDADGRSVDSTTLYSTTNSSFPPNRGLDVLTGPGGAILAIDYSGNKIRTQVPDDLAAVGVTPYDITPWRAPATGGQRFVIGGVNFGSNLAGTSVLIGGAAATVTSVSDTRIHGILPPSPTGGATEPLDVVIQISLNLRTIPAAFRYLPPAPGMKSGTWRGADPMPLGLGDVASALVDGHIYLFGDGDTRTFTFDALQDSWSLSHAPRPFAGGGHAAEVVDAKIYLFGGFTAGAAGRVQIYDPILDQWSLGAPMPWNAGGCVTAAIDGIIYVGGGVAPGGGTVGNFAAYDPIQDAWTSLGTLPTAVHMAASATDGEQLFVFGGRQGMLAAQAGISEVQVYDPVAGTWRTTAGGQMGAMPLPRSSTGRAIHWNGEFYVMGGADAIMAFADVQVYDPLTDTWRGEAKMPTARQAISPSLFQGRVFVHGGAGVVGYGELSTSEVFSPR